MEVDESIDVLENSVNAYALLLKQTKIQNAQCIPR